MQLHYLIIRMDNLFKIYCLYKIIQINNFQNNKFKKEPFQNNMSYQYQTPPKHFYTPSAHKQSEVVVDNKNDPEKARNTAPEQFLSVQRSIIQANRSKLKKLLAQRKSILESQPHTPQFSPISKYSLRQSATSQNRPSKFSLNTPQKVQSQVKTQYISYNQAQPQDLNSDQSMLLKKLSTRVKGIIKNQNTKPVYFTKEANNQINHQIRNLILQNSNFRTQIQQYEITDRQKSKKIQHLTKQLNELNNIFQQKEQNHHRFVQIKNTELQNLKKYYEFEIKSIMEMMDDSLKLYWNNSLSKLEEITIQSNWLNRKIAKFQIYANQFKKKFKVQKLAFKDVTHRKVKNISEISQKVKGDIQLEDQQAQKRQFYEEVQRQKSQLQKQVQEYQQKYKQLQQGFLQLKEKNAYLVKQLQSLRFGDNLSTSSYISKLQNKKIDKMYQNIETQTDVVNKLVQIETANKQCNTIKIENANQKYSKKAEEQISQIRNELEMLNKYFTEEVQKSTITIKENINNQSLIQSFKKKSTNKNLVMVQNLAKKQRKEKNLAYIKLASLQQQLVTEKKKNQIYEEELSQHLQQNQVAQQFTEQEKRNLNIPDGYAGLQWQRIVKHKLKTVLQQIKQIQANQCN